MVGYTPQADTGEQKAFFWHKAGCVDMSVPITSKLDDGGFWHMQLGQPLPSLLIQS
jgi:hypothetical protein